MMSYIIQRMLCKGCYRFHRLNIFVWTQILSKTKKKASLLKVFLDVLTGPKSVSLINFIAGILVK